MQHMLNLYSAFQAGHSSGANSLLDTRGNSMIDESSSQMKSNYNPEYHLNKRLENMGEMLYLDGILEQASSILGFGFQLTSLLEVAIRAWN